MRIHESGDASTAYGGRFTGTVTLEMLAAAPTPDQPDVARVRFEEGAVTNWHAHPGGQHLYLLEGDGCIGTGPDGEVALAPGTFAEAPANERHYHGARPGGDATFLVITWGTTAWEDAAPQRPV